MTQVDLELLARNRRAEGHTQSYVADKLGVHKNTYYRKERGLQQFKKLEIRYLEKLYNIKLTK